MQKAITLNTCRTVRKFWHNSGQEVLVREIELFWEQLNCCGVRKVDDDDDDDDEIRLLGTTVVQGNGVVGRPDLARAASDSFLDQGIEKKFCRLFFLCVYEGISPPAAPPHRLPVNCSLIQILFTLCHCSH